MSLLKFAKKSVGIDEETIMEKYASNDLYKRAVNIATAEAMVEELRNYAGDERMLKSATLVNNFLEGIVEENVMTKEAGPIGDLLAGLGSKAYKYSGMKAVAGAARKGYDKLLADDLRKLYGSNFSMGMRFKRPPVSDGVMNNYRTAMKNHAKMVDELQKNPAAHSAARIDLITQEFNNAKSALSAELAKGRFGRALGNLTTLGGVGAAGVGAYNYLDPEFPAGTAVFRGVAPVSTNEGDPNNLALQYGLGGAAAGAGLGALYAYLSNDNADADSILHSALVGAGVGGTTGALGGAITDRQNPIYASPEFNI